MITITNAIIITIITIAIVTIAIITIAIITIAIITIAIITIAIITIAIITIAVITIAIITIAIITISRKCVHIHPQSVGSEQLIPLENLSQRSALPKIQLSTFLVESQAAIVNTMTVRHREISSRWLRKIQGSNYDID
jgi:hypothetical protein